MKIANSQVTMGSARQYMQMGNSANRKQEGNFLQYVSESSESDYRYKDTYDKNCADQGDGYSNSQTVKRIEGNDNSHTIKSLDGTDPIQNADGINKTGVADNNTGSRATALQYSLLQLLMHRLFYSYMQGGVLSWSGGGAGQRMITYEEYEDSAFYAQGRALTEDGRQIDFNIDVMMSRSYMEYMDMPMMQLGNALCDPLVVHLDSSYTQISDQKFRFDLDADGVEDSISMPGKGSGFLALDRNEDGVINDGSELFGTSSGNGFADLQAYDSDGNGWIDENDEIYDKLKVWCKGEDGRDILMNLKEADIGAIFLGAKETEFSMYGLNGGLNGVVRSTGFFLKESGGASTIQQMDLAKGEVKEPKKTSEYMGYTTGSGGVAMEQADYQGILTVSTPNIGSVGQNEQKENRETRQYQTNKDIAREREDRNYRSRVRRNRRLQEERIARQRNQRKRRKQEEEELLLERQQQDILDRRSITEDQIEKLLEDRSFSYI